MSKHSVESSLSLSDVVEHFEQWRQTRTKRTAIPPSLMDQALSLVGRYTFTRITRSLRLSPATFRMKCIERGLLKAKPGKPDQPMFVKIKPEPSAPPSSIEMAVHRPDGVSMGLRVTSREDASRFIMDFLKG